VSETISITTYVESELIALPGESEGDKGGHSTVPGWGGIVGHSNAAKVETGFFVRRELPKGFSVSVNLSRQLP